MIRRLMRQSPGLHNMYYQTRARWVDWNGSEDLIGGTFTSPAGWGDRWKSLPKNLDSSCELIISAGILTGELFEARLRSISALTAA